jgi:hypothetical protein
MSIQNVQERFQSAAGILVDEKGRIKERLLIAYASQLSGVDLHALPPAMVKEFESLRYALSDVEMPYGYGEHAAKKIHDMSEDEAAELARSIFEMFLKLVQLE